MQCIPEPETLVRLPEPAAAAPQPPCATKHRASDHRLAISDPEIDAAGDAIARIDNGGSVEPRLGANQGLNAQDRLMRSSRLPQRQIHRKTGHQSGQGGEDRSGDLRDFNRR